MIKRTAAALAAAVVLTTAVSGCHFHITAHKSSQGISRGNGQGRAFRRS